MTQQVSLVPAVRQKYPVRCYHCDKLVVNTDYKVIGISLQGWPDNPPRSVVAHRDCSLYSNDPVMHSRQCQHCKEQFESTRLDERFCSEQCEREYSDWKRAGMPQFYHAPDSELIKAVERGEGIKELVTSLQMYVDRTPVADAPLPADPTSESVNFVPEQAQPFMPRNEQGVIVLFSMVVEQLGYSFVSIGTAFPDATLLTPEGRRLEVEFEFSSRNFLAHGHSLAGCDLVICWEEDADLSIPTIALHEHYDPKHGTWDFSRLN